MSRRTLTLIGLLWAQQAAAQAWTQPAGGAYVKLAYGASTAAEQYGFDGQRKLYADDVYEPAFWDRSVYLYSELGLTSDLTLVVGVPYKRLVVRDDSFRYDNGGLGDLDLGARWAVAPLRAFLPGGSALAVNARLGLPTGYVRNQTPALGAGNVDATLTLDYGHGWSWAYAQVGAGYRVRTPFYGLSTATACQPGQSVGCVVDAQPDLGDEWIARAELGARPFGPVLLQALASAVFSREAPVVGFSVGEPSPTRQRYAKVGAGVYVDVWDHLGLSAQGFVTPWGQNTVNSIDLFVGVSTDFPVWRP